MVIATQFKEPLLNRCLQFFHQRKTDNVRDYQLFGFISNQPVLKKEVGGSLAGLKDYVNEHLSAHLRIDGESIRRIDGSDPDVNGIGVVPDNPSGALSISDQIYDICIDAFSRKGTATLSSTVIFGYFSTRPEIRKVIPNGTSLLNFLKQNLAEKFTFGGPNVTSVDMQRYFRDKQHQIQSTKDVLAEPKSKRQLEEEELQKLLEPEADPYVHSLEEASYHFFLAIFRALDDPEYLPVPLALDYLHQHKAAQKDEKLLNYVGRTKKQLTIYFKQRSQMFVYHPQSDTVSLQPIHIRNTLLVLNQQIYKKSRDGGGRNFGEVSTLWQYSNRIPDEARQELGPNDEDLKRIIKSHSWIFSEGFNFANISSKHELPKIDHGKITAFPILFEISRSDLDEYAEGNTRTGNTTASVKTAPTPQSYVPASSTHVPEPTVVATRQPRASPVPPPYAQLVPGAPPGAASSLHVSAYNSQGVESASYLSNGPIQPAGIVPSVPVSSFARLVSPPVEDPAMPPPGLPSPNQRAPPPPPGLPNTQSGNFHVCSCCGHKDLVQIAKGPKVSTGTQAGSQPPVMVDAAMQTVKTQEDLLRRMLFVKERLREPGPANGFV